MSNVALYLIGFLIIIAASAYGATLLGVPTTWVVIGGAILFGIGVVGAVGTRRREESPVD